MDNDDYARLGLHPWFVSINPGGHNYAFRWITNHKTAYRLSLHEEVLNFRSGRTHVIDHINRDPLDNRKENLRICTVQQNAWNRRASRRKKSSKYKCINYEGTYTHKGKKYPLKKPWRLTIHKDKKRIVSETFTDEHEAYLMSQQKLKELHGQYAYLTPWTGYSNPKHPNKPINYQPESDH